VLEAFIVIVMITAFHLVYCLPALFVRTVAGTDLAHADVRTFRVVSHLAALGEVRRRTTDGGSGDPRASLPAIADRDPKGAAPQRRFTTRAPSGCCKVWYGAGEPYVSVPVYHPDVRTTATLADIARQLNARVRVSDDTANH
jgi:hypothetical protein